MDRCSVDGCDRGVYADGLCTLHHGKGQDSPQQVRPIDRRHKVCTNCGYVGKPRKYTKGSIGVELILWICFLIPGLIYSVWRLTSRYDGCPKCHHPHMIPADSPMAQKYLAG